MKISNFQFPISNASHPERSEGSLCYIKDIACRILLEPAERFRRGNFHRHTRDGLQLGMTSAFGTFGYIRKFGLCLQSEKRFKLLRQEEAHYQYSKEGGGRPQKIKRGAAFFKNVMEQCKQNARGHNQNQPEQ